MNVGIETEAALFPEKEYLLEISFALWICAFSGCFYQENCEVTPKKKRVKS
jgi:hypothetical protein